MEFEDFSQDFNDLWTADYGETMKGSSDIFDLSYLLDGGQPTTPEVLNDRLMTEASLGLVCQLTKTSGVPTSSTVLSIPIKSEHSYSLSRDKSARNKQSFLDIDDECFPAVSIADAAGTQTLQDGVHRNLALTNIDLSSDIPDVDQLSTSDTMSCCDEADFTDDCLDDVLTETCPETTSNNYANESILVGSNDNAFSINSQMFEHVTKSEASITDSSRTTSSSTLTCSTNSSLPGFTICSGLRQINIPNSLKSISQNCHNAKNLFPFSIPISEHSFVQSSDRDGNYPPTPPSSSGSDNESICTSPPGTPLYETLSPQYCSPIKKFSLKSSRTPISTPLISSQPKGATGALNLTHEEKRTLISEGYPIPSKLPLTKIEEKSLKKIRRKIKNKISAQESRRKKKEYMDKLEGKVEDLQNESGEYKKRIAILQKKNSALQHELRSLQNIVARDEGRRSHSDCSINL